MQNTVKLTPKISNRQNCPLPQQLIQSIFAGNGEIKIVLPARKQQILRQLCFFKKNLVAQNLIQKN